MKKALKWVGIAVAAITVIYVALLLAVASITFEETPCDHAHGLTTDCEPWTRTTYREGWREKARAALAGELPSLETGREDQ